MPHSVLQTTDRITIECTASSSSSLYVVPKTADATEKCSLRCQKIQTDVIILTI